MDYNQAYNTILTWITDNNNKEITAAIMRDVLKTLLDFADENIGDTGDLFQETNTVAAINELYSLVNGININAPLQVIYGAPNPNTTPPIGSFQAPDIYVREEDALRTVYMYNGVSWVEIMNFKLAVLKNGSFVGSASRMNFLGGNWDISFDPITGQTNIQVTGAGVAKLEDVGDVPPYPNDGKVYKLNEENGVLTWEEDAGGAFIPLSGTEVGKPVTGNVQIASQNCMSGVIENTIIGIGDELDLFNDAGRLSAIEFGNSSSDAIVSLTAANDAYGQSLRLFEGGSASYVRISSANPIFKGLEGQSYYGANYDDNTYVQKKYVDDEIAAAGGGQVDSVVGTAGQIEVNNADPKNPVLSLATAVTDAIAGKLDIADFVEEKVVGTAIYNGAMTGTVNLDLSTFADLYGILTGNTAITVTNTPASGESFVRSATIKSTATESLQLPVGWKLIGEYKADGSENDLEMKFTNYPTVGLKVLVYINEIP